MIAISDIHSSENFLKYFKKEFKGIKKEVFLFGGDFLTFDEPKSFLLDFLSFLRELKKDNKIFAIPGNSDGIFVERSLNELGINIDKKRVEIEGSEFNVVGIGGSLKTPFFTPNERSEEEFNSIFDLVDEKTIILSHSPPFGIFDTVRNEHIGSKSLRNIIEEKSPSMFLCGHVHEVYGVKEIKNTKIIKLPPATKGFITRINKEVSFERMF
ncbi:MAG: metallophosphoesterase family protein [Candidatus Micrarchaeia archaeon]